MRTTSGLPLVFLLLSLVLAGFWAPAASFLLPALPSFVTNFDFKKRATLGGLSASTTRDSSNMSGIKVVSEPDEATLTEMGVRNWPKWGCEPSEFPWTYGEAETCHAVEWPACDRGRGRLGHLPCGHELRMESKQGHQQTLQIPLVTLPRSFRKAQLEVRQLSDYLCVEFLITDGGAKLCNDGMKEMSVYPDQYLQRKRNHHWKTRLSAPCIISLLYFRPSFPVLSM
ncbi:enzyme of the cupin superfamily [Nannochloropsis gaditana]|uniref:Enzyme of the cupin superfamily n=1 Tax=Nannochloropsis gaditana TaxID=72520 RepID=W7TKV3_9STRA|nr:enzyme of the cupin superfamily [Nannochloropsis gaditana]